MFERFKFWKKRSSTEVGSNTQILAFLKAINERTLRMADDLSTIATQEAANAQLSGQVLAVVTATFAAMSAKITSLIAQVGTGNQIPPQLLTDLQTEHDNLQKILDAANAANPPADTTTTGGTAGTGSTDAAGDTTVQGGTADATANNA